MRIFYESLSVTDPRLLDLKFGKAISVKINGKEYKYTPVDDDPLLKNKYKGDLSKVLNSIKYMLSIPAPRKVVDFLKNHFIVFEDITCAPVTYYMPGIIKPYMENIEDTDPEAVDYLRSYIKAFTTKSPNQIDREIEGFLEEYPNPTVKDLEKMDDILWYWFGCDKENEVDYPDHHFLESDSEELDDNFISSYKGYTLVDKDGYYTVLNGDNEKVGQLSSDKYSEFTDFVDNLARKEVIDGPDPIEAWKYLTRNMGRFTKALGLSGNYKYSDGYAELYKYFGFPDENLKSDPSLSIIIGNKLAYFMQEKNIPLSKLPEELAKSMRS